MKSLSAEQRIPEASIGSHLVPTQQRSMANPCRSAHPEFRLLLGATAPRRAQAGVGQGSCPEQVLREFEITSGDVKASPGRPLLGPGRGWGRVLGDGGGPA